MENLNKKIEITADQLAKVCAQTTYELGKKLEEEQMIFFIGMEFSSMLYDKLFSNSNDKDKKEE
jgi:hypothetical protein